MDGDLAQSVGRWFRFELNDKINQRLVCSQLRIFARFNHFHGYVNTHSTAYDHRKPLLKPQAPNRSNRSFRLLLALTLFTSALQLSGSAQTTILSEGFEGAFPGSWSVG